MTHRLPRRTYWRCWKRWAISDGRGRRYSGHRAAVLVLICLGKCALFRQGPARRLVAFLARSWGLHRCKSDQGNYVLKFWLGAEVIEGRRHLRLPLAPHLVQQVLAV